MPPRRGRRNAAPRDVSVHKRRQVGRDETQSVGKPQGRHLDASRSASNSIESIRLESQSSGWNQPLAVQRSATLQPAIGGLKGNHAVDGVNRSPSHSVDSRRSQPISSRSSDSGSSSGNSEAEDDEDASAWPEKEPLPSKWGASFFPAIHTLPSDTILHQRKACSY